MNLWRRMTSSPYFPSGLSAGSNETNPEPWEMLVLEHLRYLVRDTTRLHSNFKTGPGFPPERFDIVNRTRT